MVGFTPPSNHKILNMSNDFYKVGATYDRDDVSVQITTQARDELILKLKEIKKSYLENEVYQLYNQVKTPGFEERNYDTAVVNSFLKNLFIQ